MPHLPRPAHPDDCLENRRLRLFPAFLLPEKSADQAGPDKPEWRPYLGSFRILTWGRTPGRLVTVGIDNRYLTYEGIRCREHLPGLFFTCDGEALDFRGTIATFRNIPLIRTKR